MTAQIVGVSSTRVSMRVPAGATTGVIGLTTPDGSATTKGLDPGVFTVVD